jgi:hypothetical protein
MLEWVGFGSGILLSGVTLYHILQFFLYIESWGTHITENDFIFISRRIVCGRFLCRKYTTQPRTVVGLHKTITASEQVMKCNSKNCSNRGNPIRSAELQSLVLNLDWVK